MRAYEVDRHTTGLGGLRLTRRPKPIPGPGEVLVRIRAVSLNFRDLAIVRGKYIRGPLSRDTIPASDGAGEVVAIGAGVEQFRVGDRVVATYLQGEPPLPLGSPLDGVLCEYAVFNAAGLLRLPDCLSFIAAATLPCAAVTAWNALMWGRRLRPGETVLVLGTGGVSVFALQLGKLAGARVIMTSSSDAKLERARALGADAVVNYVSRPDWDAAVLELTDGHGADLIVETAALGTLTRSYEAVAANGEIVLIGVLTPPAGDLSPHALMRKSATLRGIVVGDRVQFEGLLRAIELHELEPVIDTIHEFDAAPDAYRRLESGQHFGKIAIVV